MLREQASESVSLRILESLHALILEVLRHEDVVWAQTHLEARSVMFEVAQLEDPYLPRVDQFTPPDTLRRRPHVALWVYYARTLPCWCVRAGQNVPRTRYATTNHRADMQHESLTTTSNECTYLERHGSKVFRRRCAYDLCDSVVSCIKNCSCVRSQGAVNTLPLTQL